MHIIGLIFEFILIVFSWIFLTMSIMAFIEYRNTKSSIDSIMITMSLMGGLLAGAIPLAFHTSIAPDLTENLYLIHYGKTHIVSIICIFIGFLCYLIGKRIYLRNRKS